MTVINGAANIIGMMNKETKAIAMQKKMAKVYKLLNELAADYDAELLEWCNKKFDLGVEDKGWKAAIRIMNFADDLHAYSRDEFSACEE